MRFIVGLSLFAALSLQAADSIDTWFKEGSAHGNIKYYYIDTAKDGGNQPTSSQHANSIGGQLGYVTGSLYGLKLGATFMTTNPFSLPNGDLNVDQSIIGKDNGKVPGATVADGNKGFSALGEVYAQYNRDNYELWYGRKIIETPLIDAKEVRMLPSSVEGAMGSIKLTPQTQLQAGFVDKFKQRTNSRFYNIVEHALGADTHVITGHDRGTVLPASISYKDKAVAVRVYDYYASDFMNSVYADATLSNKLDSGISYSASVQAIAQESIGNADSYLASSAKYGGKINAQEIGAKLSTTYDESTLMAACTHVFSNSGDHDSLVLPWDGTPLFTNMLTANSLFMSNYGDGMKSDSANIGGTTGLKIGYNQKFDFTGFKGLNAGLSYAHYANGRFPSAEEDVNGEIVYGIAQFSLALKGIWVTHNTSMGYDPHATANVNGDLTQYRVIANYKF